MQVGALARPVTCLREYHSLGDAAERMRRAAVTALPVVDGDSIIGVLYEEDLVQGIRLDNGKLPSTNDGTVVHDVMHRDVLLLPASCTVGEAVRLINESNVSAFPVMNADGTLRGVITRADVISAACHGLRPDRIGGMATPLGVHLHAGFHRAGPGDIGLLLTGSMMALLMSVSEFIGEYLLNAVDHAADTNWSQSFVGMVGPEWFGFRLLIFFGMMRLSFLTGIHGAEHQVVHAIERGEPLAPDIVASMPLVHARCGTNLMMAITIMVMVVLFAQGQSQPEQLLTHIMGVAFVLLTWRRIGALAQKVFTTKRPSLRQLQGAVRVGDQLLKRYRADPTYRPGMFRVIWNMGLLQVMLGAYAVWMLVEMFWRVCFRLI